jgi:hypothetical protein
MLRHNRPHSGWRPRRRDSERGSHDEPITAHSLLALAAIPAFARPPSAEEPAPGHRAEVLVLGVYHMANPGRDIFMAKAQDEYLASHTVLETLLYMNAPIRS